MRKSAHVMLVVALASIFAGPSFSALAQQPAAGGAAAPASGTTGPVVAGEAELKGTIFTFQADIQVARHQYYRWRGNCYYRKPSGDFAPVAPGYCS
jgi:hypothetical protein